MAGKILVTGATGNVGTDLVKALTSKGEHVRAMVRDPEKAASMGRRGQALISDLARKRNLFNQKQVAVWEDIRQSAEVGATNERSNVDPFT